MVRHIPYHHGSIMTIAVCDDEKAVCADVIRKIRALSPAEEIYEFHNGRELIDSGIYFDLVFLDIEMPELDGMHTAQILCRQQKETLIVFLTGCREYMPDAFKVRAFRYICKPIADEEFREAFAAGRQALSERIMISVRQDHVTYTIPLDDVICFEAYGDGTYVYTEDCIYNSALPLKKWYLQVQAHSFYQVHRTYVISLRYIQNIGTNEITLRGMKMPVPVSRRCRAGLKDAFLLYMQEYAR